MTDRHDTDSLLSVVSTSLDEAPLALGTVAMAVIRLMSDPDISLQRIAHAILSDPGLSARIIRKANSAFYATGTRTTTVPMAIMKIGFPATRSMVISASVQAMYRKGEGNGLEEQLWRHSIAVAIGARMIAERVGSRLMEEAFLTGLVHDIGKLVLLQRFPAEYTPILHETQNHPDGRLELEMDRMGFTHADLGVMVLDRWNFASSEVRAVQYHHNPLDMPAYDSEGTDLSSALQLAQIVATANNIAKSMEHTAGPHSSPIKRTKSDHFDFDQDDLIVLAEDVLTAVHGELQVFGIQGSRLT